MRSWKINSYCVLGTTINRNKYCLSTYMYIAVVDLVKYRLLSSRGSNQMFQKKFEHSRMFHVLLEVFQGGSKQ